MDHDAVHVLIAWPLEAEFAARIAAVDRRSPCSTSRACCPSRATRPITRDRRATCRRRTCTGGRTCGSRPTSASTSTGRTRPRSRANCPRLRWVQGTSAGIGGLLQRTGLDKTALMFTTAAGVHGVPLAEFALLGLLYFAKGVPRLTQWKARAALAAATRPVSCAGSRALLVGLGGVGRQVAPLLSAAGIAGHRRGTAGPQLRRARGDVLRRPTPRSSTRHWRPSRRADPRLPADRADPGPDRRAAARAAAPRRGAW